MVSRRLKVRDSSIVHRLPLTHFEIVSKVSLTQLLVLMLPGTAQAMNHELFWSIGDGGPQNDPYDRSQDVYEYHGSIIRISVYTSPDYTGYCIPSDNPFATGGETSCAFPNKYVSRLSARRYHRMVLSPPLSKAQQKAPERCLRSCGGQVGGYPLTLTLVRPPR